MRDRAFIHVAGPRGAGKTSLVERLLQSTPSRVCTVARCERDDELDTVAVTSDDAELERYRAAGAADVIRFRFPEKARQHDAFFGTNFVNSYSSALITEGDSPLKFDPDLRVFVAPPLAEDQSLLIEREVDHTAAHAATLKRLEAWRDSPGARGNLLSRVVSEEGRAAGMLPTLDEILQQSAAGSLEALRARGVPPPDIRYSLADGYDGIQFAQVVVINVRNDDERRRAETMVDEVHGLRREEKLFRQLAGGSASRRQISIRIADVSEPEAGELQQAVRRIRRALP